MTSTEYVAGLFDLTGHVGIITGGSRGLGFGQVKVLTDAGATVYNLDLIPHSDEQMIREGHLIDIRCDVTDYDAVEKVVKGIVEKERQLDFLINNAGITFKCRAEEFPLDRFEKNPDRKAAALAKPMLPHFGDPVEIGYMMLFLLSGASTYLTGQDFPVDGGAIPHGF